MHQDDILAQTLQQYSPIHLVADIVVRNIVELGPVQVLCSLLYLSRLEFDFKKIGLKVSKIDMFQMFYSNVPEYSKINFLVAM